MLHIGFSRDLAKINFKDRATSQGGRITYRLADGSGHVSLDTAEWRAMSAEFDEESGQVLRKARRWLILLLPCIFVYGMTLAQVMPGGGLVIVVAFFLGPPAIYFWQSHRIKRIAQRIESDLAGRPKVVAPPRPPWRVPRAIEIACAVLVGPHLILEVFGSIYPEAYRNTPMLGTSLNWTSLVSFSIIAAIFYFHWRNVQYRAHAACRRAATAFERPVAPEAPIGRTFGRKVDSLARTRDSLS